MAPLRHRRTAAYGSAFLLALLLLLVAVAGPNGGAHAFQQVPPRRAASPPEPAMDVPEAAPQQQQQAPEQELRPLVFSDLERMDTEADERWRNRPRPIQRLGGPIGEPDVAEPLLCSLPHMGVSPGVLAQLKRNKARRDAEQLAKQQQEAQQQQQQQEAQE